MAQAIFLTCAFFALLGASSGHTREGFLLTMPQVLRHGDFSKFCLRIYSENSSFPNREATLNFHHSDSGQHALKIEDTFPVGTEKCVQFAVPKPGEYDMILSNSTDIMHDSVKVTVLSDKLITLVQTDKRNYKPGQIVKFRILTLMSNLKPRIGNIENVYIKDPNGIRVKQFLNIDSQGISSLEFQLGEEAKLGKWKIEVNLDEEEEKSGQTTLGAFVVKEYVLPRFEVTVEPPPYILATDKTISGKVCGKYTYGKPVSGFLKLEVCWKARYGPPTSSCHRNIVELDGCYNFTVNATDIKKSAGYHFYGGAELEIRAQVTEAGTGAIVSYNHTGPGESATALTLKLDDYTNSYFKPGLPYYGKVIAKNPDGSPAPGELIQVTASRDHGHQERFSKNVTTDASGVAVFALCGEFNDNTTYISINAIAVNYIVPTPQPVYGPPTSDRLSTPSDYRRVRQWFSPSLSYLHIAGVESEQACGDTLNLNVAYTTRAGASHDFHYQVMSRGTVVKTGHVRQEEGASTDTGPGAPPSSMCLQPEVVPTPENQGNEEDAAHLAIGSPGYPIIEDLQGNPSDGFEEPVVRSADVSNLVSSFSLDLMIDPGMSPKFTVLVYHVMPDGEVVADSMDFDVATCFDNQVSLQFNTSEALPGQVVALKLGAAAGSLCGLGVVDKSVNIMSGEHQITPAKIFDKIQELSHGPQSIAYQNDHEYCEGRLKKLEGEDLPESDDMYWHYSSKYVDALEAFKSSGLMALSDLHLETRPCSQYPPVYYAAFDRVVLKANRASGEDFKSSIRSNFPETWLWELAIVGPTGKAELPQTAPDTITTWTGSAMCINKDQGFGMSDTTSLTTFQAFFLSVHLPYAAVRGERLPVLLTVYNYLKKCITVKVSLDMGGAFRVHNYRRLREPVCVCGGKSHTAKYYVTPRQIGSLPVVAKATIVDGKCRESVDIDITYRGMSDEVHRKMLVKAEGVEQSYSHSSYICSKDGKPIEEQVKLLLPGPKELVKKSARGEVTVIGDIMGPALSNLDHLVRMPTGCGEQNMVGFVPNILVLNYLGSVGQLSEKTKTSAIQNMEAGYQRELNYRHEDGSFSAFGDRDPAGSVWLTAFVVKSFAQARKYIFIDEADLERSMTFLTMSQLETGCFRETGKVFSSHMMGGLGKSRRRDTPQTALTAYVLIALMQAGMNKGAPTFMTGIECMNKQVRSRRVKKDAYTMSLVAYANMMYDPESTHTANALKELQALSKGDDSVMYWSRGNLQPPATNTWLYTTAPSAEVEMTSYALMTYLIKYGAESIEQSHKIAMWLTRQRNSMGGFASTQDTVVGLDALSQFAGQAYSSEPSDLQVKLSLQGTPGPFKSQVFNVTDIHGDTRYLLQTMPIPSLPADLNISTSGVGCALVQANVRYNKPPRKYLGGERPRFWLKVSSKPYQHDRDRCDRRSVAISVGTKRIHKFSKGMGLVSMKLVTSWAPTADSITDLKSQFPKLGMKRVEHNEEEGVLTFYFDEFTRKAKRFTVDVEQDRDLAVSNPRPAEVKVYEYYETDVANVQSYRIKTTCGTKAEIPHKPISPPVPGVQVRLNAPIPPAILQQRRQLQSRPPSMGQGCPNCITRRKLPDNFDSMVCNSSAVYKAVTGRSGVHSIKLRQDLRPSEIEKRVTFTSFTVPPGCSCSLLDTEGGPKRAIIMVTKKVFKKMLTLDSSSVVMTSTRKAEKAVRKAQESCPL